MDGQGLKRDSTVIRDSRHPPPLSTTNPSSVIINMINTILDTILHFNIVDSEKMIESANSISCNPQTLPNLIKNCARNPYKESKEIQEYSLAYLVVPNTEDQFS